MITANFSAYNTYATDSVTQWDVDRVLRIPGLNLTTAPEVHFSNSTMDKAIVRQSKLENHVVVVNIPNSLLQMPYAIIAHIGIYEGGTFKVIEQVKIPVKPRTRPSDYVFEGDNEEVYSFKALENAIANMTTKAEAAGISARIDTIVANANKTDGNSELVDIRVDINGNTRQSAGTAVREQVGMVFADLKAFDTIGSTTFYMYAGWKVGGLTNGEWVYQINRIMSTNTMLFDRDIVIKIADGFRIGVHTLTAAGDFIADSGWQQNEYKVAAGTYFRIVIARVTEINESPSILEFSSAVTFNTRMETKVESLQKQVNKTRKAWLTSAHRGFVDSALRENSLAAYYNAYLNGADMIETDAWLASDGVLVVNHDSTVTGTNASGQQVTYTISETPSTALCALVLSDDDRWGVQHVPTLSQVLRLAYHTGLQVNIDIKNGIASAEAVVELVREHGLCGRVVYALNGSGMDGITAIMSIDPDARFIDSAANFATAVAGFADRGKRCYAYTGDISDTAVNTIRESGCMLALISLNASNFEAAIAYHPDMCEYLHTSDFRKIEDDYFESIKLY